MQRCSTGSNCENPDGLQGFFGRKYTARYFWTKKVRGSCSGSKTQHFVMRIWWWGIKSEILKVAVFVLTQDDDVCVWIQFLGAEWKKWVRYTREKCPKDLGSIHFYLRGNNCGKVSLKFLVFCFLGEQWYVDRDVTEYKICKKT